MDVLKGLAGKPAVAAKVVEGARAVHELLLREKVHLSVAQEVMALEAASRGKRPARAAGALVLDGCHDP